MNKQHLNKQMQWYSKFEERGLALPLNLFIQTTVTL